MAIKEVPIITGPTYGGVIYGLSLQTNYSSAPSVLTLNIVSDDGQYTTPRLGQPQNVSFGNFVFRGYVWSYDFKTTSDSRTLDIKLIDRSVLLDRYYVLLWKRGLFDISGSVRRVNKVIEFDKSDRVLIPERRGFVDIRFVERQYPNQTVTRQIREARGSFRKNILYVGREKFPNSRCEIPDTEYNLDDLKTISPVDISMRTIDPKYTATYEGTLREVLQNWGRDFGFDFYWDFSSSSDRTALKFYDVSQGINLSLNDYTGPEVIESSESQSLEGTFEQYAISYTRLPREKTEPLTANAQIIYSLPLNPYPISYFLKRNNTIQEYYNSQDADIDESKDPSSGEKRLWGGRTREEFLKSAFLGYAEPQLRDLFILNNRPSDIAWWVTGITPYSKDGNPITGGDFSLSQEDKENLINVLKLRFDADIKEMEEIDEINLKNYNVYLCSTNDEINSRWKAVEKDILNSFGSVYRLGPTSQQIYACFPNYILEIEVTADPNSSEYEPKTSIFSGRRVFKRGGAMSHDQEAIASLLELDTPEFQEIKEKLKIRDLDLISSGVRNSLYSKSKATQAIFIPNANLIKKYIGNFDVRILRGANEQEVTTKDTQDAIEGNPCKGKFEKELKKRTCTGVREEAEELALKELLKGGGLDRSDEPKPPTAGLQNNRATGAEIEINKKKLKFFAPSDSRYESVFVWNYNIQKLLPNESPESIFFDVDSPPSSNIDLISQIDVIFQDETNPGEDEFAKRVRNKLPKPRAISNIQPQINKTIVFAGEPKGNLSPSAGLSKLEVSYSSEGFRTTVGYSSRPSQRTKVENSIRRFQSQISRNTFN
jgi:hypothetical protein